MKARDIMTRDVASCAPDSTIRDAARTMSDRDCGCLPVHETGTGVVGIITDRDIAIRAVGAGLSPDTPVRTVMSAGLTHCSADDDISVIEEIMADQQVRRVPVVDGGRCVGIVAQADIARRHEHLGDSEVALVIERISEPNPSRHEERS